MPLDPEGPQNWPRPIWPRQPGRPNPREGKTPRSPYCEAYRISEGHFQSGRHPIPPTD